MNACDCRILYAANDDRKRDVIEWCGKHAAVDDLIAALERFAVPPEEVPNQDEQGGCVYCGGHPPREWYGYATKVEHHEPDCEWLYARAALARATGEAVT